MLKLKSLLVLSLLFICTQLIAQNKGLNFQGVARNSNNVIIASQAINLKLSILKGNANGNVEYSETRSVTTNAQGLFSVVIGDGIASANAGNFNLIDWSDPNKFLKIEIDINNGSNFTQMGVTQIQYVAYAHFSDGVAAENIAGVVPVIKGGTGVSSISALRTALSIDKTSVGLSNVDNISDLKKPISSATQTALDTKLNISDSLTQYITPSALTTYPISNTTQKALDAKLNISDSLTQYVTPSSLTTYPINNATQTALDTKLNISDSVKQYVTPEKFQSLQKINSLNGLRDSVQSFTFSTVGLRPNINSAASVHTINIPLASNSLVSAGLVSKSEYDQFYNKSDFSGDYNDLANKPLIPAAQVQSNWDQTDITKFDFIKNKPILSTIAQTGNYADLNNRPTILDLNGIPASRNLTINGVTYDMSKDRNWNIDLSTSGIDFSKNIISGVLPIQNGGTGSSTLNFVDLTNNQTVAGSKQFTNAISVGASTPEVTAIVDINSTSKGFLPPRMTTAQRNAIVNPAIGLTIFNTETNCLEWWIGTIWYNACGNAAVSTTTNGTANVTILDCASGAANGVIGGSYDIGSPITSANSWQVIRLKVNTIGTYTFNTTVNGITFSKSDQFYESDRLASISGYKDVYVPASGAAINAGTYTYKLATNPSCEFTVHVNTTSSNGSSVITSWAGSTTPSGTMMDGKLLNSGEVSQTLTAVVGTIGTYKILAENNGVAFTSEGTFPSLGNNQVVLTGTGTPINSGTYTFTTNTDPVKSFARTFLSSTSNGTAVISNFTSGTSVGNLYINNLVESVTQTIVANVTTAGTYSFTASLNGVSFSASGTFTGTGSQNIVLIASGTPNTEGYNNYSLNSSVPYNFSRQTLSSPSSNGTSVVNSWSCSTDTSGSLYLGNLSNYVTQTITANVSTPGTYYLSATLNGITFAATGIFDGIGNKEVILKATGTPTSFGANNFTINTSNSCTFVRYVKNNLTSNGSAVVNSYTLGSAAGILYANSEIITITQQIVANVKSVGTYSLSTSVNGITYTASGTFTSTGNQTITLHATGTPIAIGSFTATLNTTPSFSFAVNTAAQPSTNGTGIVSSYTIASYDNNRIYNLGIANNTTYNLYANVTKLGTYNISKTVNGITISASGTFNALGEQFILVDVKGTATSLGNFTISTNTNFVASWNFKVVNESSGGSAVISNAAFSPSSVYFYPNVDATGITATLSVNVTTLGTYNITTSANNITFSGSGTFTSLGNQTITLNASGIPNDNYSHRFFVIINSSSGIGAILDTWVYNASSNGTSTISNIRLGSSSGFLEVNKLAIGVTQEIKVNVTTLGTYNITASANNITFSGSGTFTSLGEKIITLSASGTPTLEGNNQFILNVTPNFSFNKQVISTVTIGTQVWMKKNLDVATYGNGDPIPLVTDPVIWANLTSGAYCYYNNDSATYAAIYGKLYNWYAVTDPRGFDMQGWHMPTMSEFVTLGRSVGTGIVGKLKSIGTTLWLSPNTGATNSSNFTGLPGGGRSALGVFYQIREIGSFWGTNYEDSNGNVASMGLYYDYSGDALYRYSNDKKNGFSVRLIKN